MTHSPEELIRKRLEAMSAHIMKWGSLSQGFLSAYQPNFTAYKLAEDLRSLLADNVRLRGERDEALNALKPFAKFRSEGFNCIMVEVVRSYPENPAPRIEPIPLSDFRRAAQVYTALSALRTDPELGEKGEADICARGERCVCDDPGPSRCNAFRDASKLPPFGKGEASVADSAASVASNPTAGDAHSQSEDVGAFILTVTATADGHKVAIDHPMGSDAWLNARDAMTAAHNELGRHLAKQADCPARPAMVRNTDAVCTTCNWRAGHSPDCPRKDEPWPMIPLAAEYGALSPTPPAPSDRVTGEDAGG